MLILNIFSQESLAFRRLHCSKVEFDVMLVSIARVMFASLASAISIFVKLIVTSNESPEYIDIIEEV